MRRGAALLFGLLGAALLGCTDAVHDDAVAALGDESPDVPAGPLHRPGQPCVVCHDGSGPGSMVLSFGGTAYQDDVHATPLVAAKVRITDVKKHSVTAVTNCAGNFFVQAADYTPTYPVHVEVDFGSLAAKMTQHIGRDGSCASCHTGKDQPSSVVHIYLTTDPMMFPPTGCK
jgi:hypothetical protein